MTTPRTPAGRALLTSILDYVHPADSDRGAMMTIHDKRLRARILAIEAEAAAPDALLREALDAIRAEGGREYADNHRHGYWWEGVMWATDPARVTPATPPASAERDAVVERLLDALKAEVSMHEPDPTHLCPTRQNSLNALRAAEARD